MTIQTDQLKSSPPEIPAAAPARTPGGFMAGGRLAKDLVWRRLLQRCGRLRAGCKSEEEWAGVVMAQADIARAELGVWVSEAALQGMVRRHATWAWHQQRHFETFHHGPKLQQKRALKGGRRRRAAVRPRDELVVEFLRHWPGTPFTVVGPMIGLDRTTVTQLLGRVAPDFLRMIRDKYGCAPASRRPRRDVAGPAKIWRWKRRFEELDAARWREEVAAARHKREAPAVAAEAAWLKVWALAALGGAALGRRQGQGVAMNAEARRERNRARQLEQELPAFLELLDACAASTTSR